MESLPRSVRGKLGTDEDVPRTVLMGGIPCIFCSKYREDSGGIHPHSLVDHLGREVSPHNGRWLPISVCYSRLVIKDSNYPWCSDCTDWQPLLEWGGGLMSVCSNCGMPMILYSRCPFCRQMGDVV